MVIDPNGQISVSYLNASGKTIATALTGKVPDNVDSLSSYPEKKTEQIKLLEPERFVFNDSDLRLSATTTYLASLPGPVKLGYSIEKLISRYPGGSFQPCSNCYYELTVNVVNDCNTNIYISAGPVKIGKDSTDCNDEGLYQDTLDLTIPQIGEYYVTFDFALSKEVIEKYTGDFISKGQDTGALKKEFDFVKDYLDSLQLSDCFGDCRTCNDMLGTKEIFTLSMGKKLLELGVDSVSASETTFISYLDQKYMELKANCTLISQNCYTASSPCSQYEVLMKEDVSPDGQYALFDKEGNTLEEAINVISNYWRIEFPVQEPGTPGYETELIIQEDGTSTSVHAESFTLKMFLHYWKDEWADKFLKYHPEYCKLTFCRDNSASYGWDDLLREQVTAADRIPSIPGGTNLQYDDNNPSWLLPADPFFKSGAPGAVHYNAMKADLDHYTSRVLNYAASEKGLTQFVDYMLYCAEISGTTNTNNNGTNQTGWNNCTPEAICRVADREWDYYRDTYLEIKEKYYTLLRDSTICKTACPVGVPYEPTPPGGISTADFTIEEAPATASCDTGEQPILIRYIKFVPKKIITIKVYYPGQAALVTVSFAVGEGQKTICVPGNLPLSSIKISEVLQ